MTRGRFITLEGGDGAGKTLQAARLSEALDARGMGTLLTREPGGSPGAEEIRHLLVSGSVERWEPLAEAMLHAAARRDHLLHTIEPALEQGLWVISDRFVDSMIVYQGYGQGADLDVLERISTLSLGGFEPDLTLVLDIPVADGLRRAEARAGSNRYERMGRDFHARVREGFLARARAEPGRFAVVDARADPETVGREILDIVAQRLPVPSDG
ncbi:MAG: dTMP kinase [Rhodospirillales bacterium]|nr:dTMP kinase [Rhodospirillales bacterium]MDE0379956.1 dTMP kinase [Rhodospirillales bacterium]